jgi:serine/threonine protein kinase HipA of HipAB toxin-antitoxin module
MQCNAGDDEHSQSEITTTIILEEKKEKDYKKSHKRRCISEIRSRKGNDFDKQARGDERERESAILKKRERDKKAREREGEDPS